jgi:SAM-dependent methyltransferase
MADQLQTADEQHKFWNGPTGEAWAQEQQLLDQMLKPFEELLLEALQPGSGGAVLDVGCGTGGTTVAAARRLGAGGRLVGVDISAPMLAAARERAEREGAAATFLCSSAQTHPFEPAVFDAVLSRFGVMFFDDPVRAFANLRRAAREGARLRFIAWRSPAENPFMTAAERAAAPLLPELPVRRAGAPGQFAFAERQRIEEILGGGGWAEAQIRPLDLVCTFPAPALGRYLSRMGPVAAFLQQVDAATRARVAAVVRAAFDPYLHGDEVRFAAACWLVDARA